MENNSEKSIVFDIINGEKNSLAKLNGTHRSLQYCVFINGSNRICDALFFCIMNFDWNQTTIEHRKKTSVNVENLIERRTAWLIIYLHAFSVYIRSKVIAFGIATALHLPHCCSHTPLYNRIRFATSFYYLFQLNSIGLASACTKSCQFISDRLIHSTKPSYIFFEAIIFAKRDQNAYILYIGT